MKHRLHAVFEDSLVTVYHGDSLDVLPVLADSSVHAVITDPPYGLGFMGNDWDRFVDFSAWCGRWLGECLRLLSPGGHLIVFGGSRTWHRLAVAMEDAGFEIRDSIAWLYGSGFPKSLNVAKSAAGGRRWEGWGTGLKPAFEPIIVARKPLEGTVAATVQRFDTGALHIDACRVPMSKADEAAINAKHVGMEPGGYQRPVGTSLSLSIEPMPFLPARAHPRGRWPTNAVFTHDSGCGRRCEAACPVAELDRDSPGASQAPSRLFPIFRWQPKAPRRERLRVDGHAHPTVKPLELVRWLVRLVTPPDGLVLDPFLGSGTTAEAARLEGFRCIGIEREAKYLPLIRARLNRRSV